MFNWNLNTAARTENRGAIPASTNATTITSGAADTKGTWVDIGAVTTFTYEALSIFFGNSSAAHDVVFDVGINVGGNRFVIAEDLRFSDRKDGGWDRYPPLSIHVPSGTQISIRLASSVASATADFLLVGHSCGLFGAPGYSRMVALYTPSTSRGIDCDAGAIAHTKTRTQIIASTPQRVVALLVTVGTANDIGKAAATRWLFDIEQGAGGSEQVVIPNLFYGCGTILDTITQTTFGPFPCDIAAGTRLACNIQCNVTTSLDRTRDIALHGFVP